MVVHNGMDESRGGSIMSIFEWALTIGLSVALAVYLKHVVKSNDFY